LPGCDYFRHDVWEEPGFHMTLYVGGGGPGSVMGTQVGVGPMVALARQTEPKGAAATDRSPVQTALGSAGYSDQSGGGAVKLTSDPVR